MTWESDLMRDYALSASQVSALRLLLKRLKGVSDMNLTAVTDEKKIIDLHFRDSLSLVTFPEFESAERIVDVGSGAGFPGLPLAIASPTKTFFLLDATAKKRDFINDSIRNLGLRNAITIGSRAETAGRGEYRDSFDLALARAVGPLPLVIEYVLPLLKNDGFALLQRGSREENDESTASYVATLLGGRLERIEKIKPYKSSKNLHVWVFSKISSTPDGFPRREGVAKKRPLV